DVETAKVMAALNVPDAMTAVLAERAFLEELGAGCSVPCGAHARVSDSGIALSGVMLSVDGARSVRALVTGTDPLALGRDLARALRDEMGGAALAGWQRPS
ncbi:MAG TPA: hypothetical protein VIH73_05710, partial [Acidimicrobiales bacterium]